MNELGDIAQNGLFKNLREIEFQFKNGENIGGNICSVYVGYVEQSFPKFDISLFIESIKKGVEFEITKENIHLYYKFMTDDVSIEKGFISDILLERSETIYKQFGFKSQFDFVKHLQGSYIALATKTIPYQIIFGVKDTLKPLDEYIKEIEASDGYAEYKELNT